MGVIPARLTSTRLPGKALLTIAGKPMIQHVWERACQSNLHELMIATDSPEIYKSAISFGAHAVMTSSSHQSGTERIVEVSEKYKADFYINIQGDEPLISPNLINELVEECANHGDRDVFSAANSTCTEQDFYSPNVVKVVVDQKGDALYFSRAPIPYPRDTSYISVAMKHIGIYGYTERALHIFCSSAPGTLEQIEKLEQLRFLEQGLKIRIISTKYDSLGVDVEEDLIRVKKIIEQNK